MRKLIYLFGLFFITLNFSSCNPESLVDEPQEQACCDEDEHLPPPPPPPTGSGD